MRSFTYRAAGANSLAVTQASSREEALRQLARSGVVVVSLSETSPTRAHARPPRGLTLVVLKQLAVMARAAIDLLDALEIIARSTPNNILRAALEATATKLRQGERLGVALARSAPFYPAYVYALINAGEATGKLPLVLEEAVKQLELEHRVGRDLVNALTYPAFLVASGAASVAFLFYAVVPRFADMLSNAGGNMNALSRFILDAGVAFHDNVATFAVALCAVLIGGVALSRSVEVRRWFSELLAILPLISQVLLTRQRMTWSRIMAMSLKAGVEVTEAADLAAEALPEGRLRSRVAAAVPELRAGKAVDAAFQGGGILTAVDASLVRAGQHSGALPEMFAAVADRNEADMRDALKRMTLILEPVAIASVALAIGAIVLGLVSALAGIYENIG